MACLDVQMTRIGEAVIRMALVCGTSLGERQLFLWASDSELATVTDELLTVQKYGTI